jgi:hypothetical protein
MTLLHKTVSRRTRESYAVLRNSRRKQIVVSFAPVDTISFRELRGRKTFSIPVDACFRIAVRMAAEAQRRQKLAERQAKKFA